MQRRADSAQGTHAFKPGWGSPRCESDSRPQWVRLLLVMRQSPIYSFHCGPPCGASNVDNCVRDRMRSGGPSHQDFPTKTGQWVLRDTVTVFRVVLEAVMSPSPFPAHDKRHEFRSGLSTIHSHGNRSLPARSHPHKRLSCTRIRPY